MKALLQMEDCGNLILLDEAVIRTAKTILKRSMSHREVKYTALYFFPDGAGVDNALPQTFEFLCRRNKVDSSVAAKAIWEELSEERKRFVLRLLKEAGYK